MSGARRFTATTEMREMTELQKRRAIGSGVCIRRIAGCI